MIALPEFAELTVQEQAQYLWDNGEYLLSKEGRDVTFALYSVDDFFVEIWYDKESGHILKTVYLQNSDRLDSYLKAVSLRGLFV